MQAAKAHMATRSTEIARDILHSAGRDTLCLPLNIRAAAVGAARAEQHSTCTPPAGSD